MLRGEGGGSSLSDPIKPAHMKWAYTAKCYRYDPIFRGLLTSLSANLSHIITYNHRGEITTQSKRQPGMSTTLGTITFPL